MAAQGGRPKKGHEPIYMVIEQDKYELPLFVGTLEEIAEYAGVSPVTVKSCAAHKHRNSKYERVYVDADED